MPVLYRCSCLNAAHGIFVKVEFFYLEIEHELLILNNRFKSHYYKSRYWPTPVLVVEAESWRHEVEPLRHRAYTRSRCRPQPH